MPLDKFDIHSYRKPKCWQMSSQNHYKATISRPSVTVSSESESKKSQIEEGKCSRTRSKSGDEY
jgi:hypothetical protein